MTAQGGLPLGLAQRVDRLTQALALAGFCGLVLIAVLTFYDGAARWLALPRISGFKNYGELAFPIVIASCFPAGLLRQANVSVRVLGSVFGARGATFLEAFAALVTLGFFGVLARQFVDLAVSYTEAGRTTRTVEMPLAPWWWITTSIMAVCVPVQAYVACCWLRAAVTGRTPELATLRDAAAEVG